MLSFPSNLSAVLTVILALSSTAAAANCQNSPGVANGQCVKYYSSNNCNGNTLGSYKPDCSGACFRYNSFSSFKVAGDGTYGTRCIAYSDDNCNTQVESSNNVVVGSGQCTGFPTSKSMRCYYRC